MAKVRKSVELDADNVAWLHDTYSGVGGNASLSWALDLLLTEFRKAHDSQKTPAELASIGAQELRRLLRGEA